MQKLVKLKKDNNVVFNSTISEYLDVDAVYIPVKENYKVLVKKDDNVLKGQIILENNLNKVISPISGKVIGVEKKLISGKKASCIKILNDFKEKEKSTARRKTVELSRDAIVSRLYEFYFKYIASVLETKKINNLVISGIEDEPYVMTNSYIMKKYSKEVLDCANMISMTFKIENVMIAIKSNDTTNVEEYLNKIGTYPNMNVALVEDKYLLGKSFFLMHYLGLNDIDTLVIDVKTFLEMYDSLKYSKMTYETFITVGGPNVKKGKVFKVKIGTLLEDVINKEIKLKNKDALYIVGGLMSGYSQSPSDTVITNSLKGVVIIENEPLQERKCSNCGLCQKVCPVKVNPKKIMDSKLISSKCLDCGLCSYICPSSINLRKYLRGEYE